MKLANIYFGLFLGFSTICSGINARDIDSFFISEPNEIFSTLDTNSRLDMIDYYKSGETPKFNNLLGRNSKLNKLTPNFISINTSASSKVEMFLKPIGKDTIIIVSSTYFMPMADSKLEYYDKNWKKLNTSKYFKAPTTQDFLKKVDKKDAQLVLDMVDFPIISYSLNPENGNLTAKLNLKDYYTADDYAKIAPFLNDSILYELKSKYIRK